MRPASPEYRGEDYGADYGEDEEGFGGDHHDYDGQKTRSGVEGELGSSGNGWMKEKQPAWMDNKVSQSARIIFYFYCLLDINTVFTPPSTVN